MKPETIQLQEVTLNVANLPNMTTYYQEAIGLDILAQSEQEVLLGIAETNFPLVRLVPETELTVDEGINGLYHMAIRVPSREALGNALYHWALTQIPIIGASNHGYSEAIYLEDPEGNGIEVYRDRPIEEWDIREDGRIVGITEAMDAEGVLAAATRRSEETPFRMPAGTDMGHVHLSVSNVAKAKSIWMPVLNLDDKFSVPTGSWLAVGMYHHHFAFNQWAGTHLAKRSEGQRGLASFRLAVPTQDTYEWVKEQAVASDDMTLVETADELHLTDSFGLTAIVTTLLK